MDQRPKSAEQCAAHRDYYNEENAEYAGTYNNRQKESHCEIEHRKPARVLNHKDVTRNLTGGYVSKLTPEGKLKEG